MILIPPLSPILLNLRATARKANAHFHFSAYTDSTRVSFCLVAVPATPMAYKNKLPMKEDRKHMILNSKEISASR